MSLKTKAVQELQNTSSKEVGATFLSIFLSILGNFWEAAEPSCKLHDSKLQKSYNKAFKRRTLFSILSGPVVSECALVDILNMQSFSSRHR